MKLSNFFAFSLALLILSPGSAAAEAQDDSASSGISFSSGYNRNVPPPGRTVARIGFDIQDVSEVNDKDFSISLVMSTILQWNDSRIHIEPRALEEIGKMGFYVLSPHEHGGLWLPNVNFLNLKLQSPVRDGTTNERYAVLDDEDMRIVKDEVTRTTVSCPMDFSSFPFDRHCCYVEVINVFLMLDLFEWDYFTFNGTKKWGRASSSTILPYTVDISDIGMERKRRPNNYFIAGASPTHSHAGFKIQLSRKTTPYILNYYLPSGLFVAVSWTSFVIPVEAIPGRVALLVTTFLSLANIINSAFEISPINQGINQMQIWIVSCIGFVFLAVVEYFFLLCFARFDLKFAEKEKATAASSLFPVTKWWPAFPKMASSSPRKVDGLFLLLLPLLFAAFAAAYFGYVYAAR